MQVNVFIAQDDTGAPQQLLVLPFGENVCIPDHLQHFRWRNLATTSVEDKLLTAAAPNIEMELVSRGYVLVEPAE
jgi:hypothetical protein